jgi:hypothetical protein
MPAGELAADAGTVHLVLYVSSSTLPSQRARQAMDGLVSRYPGRFRYEVVEVAENVDRAEVDRVLFAPTLVKVSPPPRAWFIGDLGEGESVIAMLRQCGLEASE